MSRYIISPGAREDLKDISRFISRQQSRPQTAARLRSRFLEHFRLLTTHPQIGEARDDLRPGVRQWTTADGFVVFFEPLDNGVAILQVVHGSRDIEAVFRRNNE